MGCFQSFSLFRSHFLRNLGPGTEDELGVAPSVTNELVKKAKTVLEGVADARDTQPGTLDCDCV